MSKQPIDLKRLKEICKALIVFVWGSDECRLRLGNEFYDTDVEEIARLILRMDADINMALAELERLRDVVGEIDNELILNLIDLINKSRSNP